MRVIVRDLIAMGMGGLANNVELPQRAVMSKINKSKRPKSNRNTRKTKTVFGIPISRLLTIVVGIGAAMGWTAFDGIKKEMTPAPAVVSANSFACNDMRVVDGDTLRCGKRRVRLAGIDAPEMPGHCRKGRECTPGDPYASTDNLKRLVEAGPLQCTEEDVDHYGRTIARCRAAGVDVSCQQIADGQAVRRYGDITC